MTERGTKHDTRYHKMCSAFSLVWLLLLQIRTSRRTCLRCVQDVWILTRGPMLAGGALEHKHFNDWSLQEWCSWWSIAVTQQFHHTHTHTHSSCGASGNGPRHRSSVRRALKAPNGQRTHHGSRSVAHGVSHVKQNLKHAIFFIHCTYFYFSWETNSGCDQRLLFVGYWN